MSKENYKNSIVRFKDIDITFEFGRMPNYDREYLKTMVIETINSKSFRCSGVPFNVKFPNADNFAMFNNVNKMNDWMSDFYGTWEHTASHLLDGKKYYLAWTYNIN